MLGEIQVKFASENCCKITQFLANLKIFKLFIFSGLQFHGIPCKSCKYDS